MEYQKLMNLLDNIPNELSPFRTKNWVEINYESCRIYKNKQIKIRTSILRSTFCD